MTGEALGAVHVTGDALLMAINLRAPDLTELKPRIVVFGVGGAGGNAVNNMVDASLDGVEFETAWSARTTDEFRGVPVCYIGKTDLIRNKKYQQCSK